MNGSNGGGSYGQSGQSGGGGNPETKMLMQQIQQLQKTVMQLQAGQGGGANQQGGGDYGGGYGGGNGGGYGGGNGGGGQNWGMGGYGNYGNQQGGGGYGYGGNDAGFGGGYGGGGGGGYPKPPLPRGGPRNQGEGGKPNKIDNRNNKVAEGEEIPSGEQRVLLVSNIPPNLSNPDGLFYAFERFGTVERIKVLHNKRSTALIQMSKPTEAQRACEEQGSLNRTGTEIFVNYSSKFRAVSLPEPGSLNDDGLTKDFTGQFPELRQHPRDPMPGGMGMGMGPGMGGGYGPMDGPMGGGFPPMMNMGAGVMDGHGMDMRRNNDNQVVLLVSNLPDQVASCASVFNMLGAYGDVVCVKILRNKRDCALVQMAKPHHAQQVRNHLDQAKIGGNKLCISNSRVDNLLNKKLMEDEGLQADYSNSRQHRFRNHQQAAKLQRNLGPPTNVLHIANVPEGYTHVDIKEMFIERGFTVKESRDCEGKANMCYLQMPNPDEALMALAAMHNHAPEEMKFKNTNGLCVSFSKANNNN